MARLLTLLALMQLLSLAGKCIDCHPSRRICNETAVVVAEPVAEAETVLGLVAVDSRKLD